MIREPALSHPEVERVNRVDNQFEFVIVGPEENTGVGFGAGNRILDPQVALSRITGHAGRCSLWVEPRDRSRRQVAANEGNRRLEKTRGSDFSQRLLLRFAGYAGQRTGHTGRRNLRIELTARFAGWLDRQDLFFEFGAPLLKGFVTAG